MMDDQKLAESIAEIFVKNQHSQYSTLDKFPPEMQKPIKLALGKTFTWTVNTLLEGVKILQSIDSITSEEIVRLAEDMCLGDYPHLDTYLQLYRIAERPEAGLARLREEGARYFRKDQFNFAINAYSLSGDSAWLVKIGCMMEERHDFETAARAYLPAGDANLLMSIGEKLLHHKTRCFDALDLAKQAFVAAKSPLKVAEVAQEYLSRALEGYSDHRRLQCQSASKAYLVAASIADEPLKTCYEQMAAGITAMVQYDT
jgi:hypothetical protein